MENVFGCAYDLALLISQPRPSPLSRLILRDGRLILRDGRFVSTQSYHHMISFYFEIFNPTPVSSNVITKYINFPFPEETCPSFESMIESLTTYKHEKTWCHSSENNEPWMEYARGCLTENCWIE